MQFLGAQGLICKAADSFPHQLCTSWCCGMPVVVISDNKHPKLCCNPLIPPQPYAGSARPDFHISVRESFGDKSILRKHYMGKEGSSEPQTEASHCVKWQPTICINWYFVVKNCYWMFISADLEMDKNRRSIMHVVFWKRNHCFQAFSQFFYILLPPPSDQYFSSSTQKVSWLLAFPLLPWITVQASKPPF